MTPTEPEGRLVAEFLAFFGEDEGRNASGYTLEQILAWDNDDWELQHDFIQWLFATNERSQHLQPRRPSSRCSDHRHIPGGCDAGAPASQGVRPLAGVLWHRPIRR